MGSDRRHVRELRDKIARYRELASQVLDAETERRILALTDELEQQARDLERGR